MTHTLAGVLLAETADRLIPPHESGLPRDARRRLFLWMLVVGSNLGDLDFVYARISGQKLGYLLHHRGHSHTLLFCLLCAALLLLAAELYISRKKLAIDRSDRKALAVVALLGPALHIAMDFTNDYGVHPFWPAYNGWFYGDSVFIVEPLFWAACAPLVFLLRSKVARGLVLLLLVAGLVLGVLSEMLVLVSIAAFVLLTLVMGWIGWRAPAPRAASAAVGVWVAVTLMFVTVSGLARSRAAALAEARSTTLDRVLTPLPANPLCWQLVLVATEGERYTVRLARLSLAPDWLPAARCPSRIRSSITAPLTRIDAESTPAVDWDGELSMPRQSLEKLAASNCEFRAFLRFARVPWIDRQEGRLIAGDLRYDREPELGFAELELSEPPLACPALVPPWLYPRSDLFGTP